MRVMRLFHGWLAAWIVMLSATTTFAQQPATQPYTPKVGQEGKDAVWVPTSEAMVQKMLDMAKVGPQDFVMDLGSGDGRMIIAAAKRGASALGVEYNPDLVEFATQEAKKAGVADKARFVQGDMYAYDISKATVLALFLLPGNIEKLTPKFLDLKPGSRIVANTLWVQGWEPDERDSLQDNCDNWCTALLFIIPAKVEGNWRVGKEQLSLTQTYQMVEGALTAPNGTKVPVKGRLRGEAITLTVGTTAYEGRVTGDTIEASPTSGSGPGVAKLIATRTR
jgi:SAM-dependent methyltransferase